MARRASCLLNRDATGLWDQEQHKEEGNALPQAEEDESTVLQAAQHLRTTQPQSAHIDCPGDMLLESLQNIQLPLDP